MEQPNIQENQVKTTKASPYLEAVNLWAKKWSESRWGIVTSKLNKHEQLQLKGVIELIDYDLAKLEKLLNYYFTNFNEKSFEKIKWKYHVPATGHFYKNIKDIEAMMLGLVVEQNTNIKHSVSQYDGNSASLMGAEWSR